MTTEANRTTKQRTAHRVVIDLPAPMMDALIRLAVREDRNIDGQARRLIADGLTRATRRDPER